MYVRNIGGSPATTLLVGGLGKGGKGYFCLDISNIDATTVAEASAATIVKWEYPNTTDPDNAPDPDIGYSFSQAYLVNSQAGWVVIFGNGYESTNKKAVLYVLNAQTGAVIRKIDTGAGGWGPDGIAGTADDECNGLSTPALIDPNLDGKVDYVYAGDMLGNLWKFDLTDANYNNWGSAYHDGAAPTPTPKPLFQARNGSGARQPITTRPDVMRHCNRGAEGYIVVFGTGRYLGAADFADYSIQSLYGIYDWADAFEAAGQVSYNKYMGYVDSIGIPPVRSNTLSNLDGNVTFSATGQAVHLLEQTMIWAGTSAGIELRVLSDNTIDWYSPDNDTGSHAGWYFDLPYQSERMVRDLIIRDGVLITISSIPSASPCASGGDSIIHELNACNGGRLSTPQFDVSGPEGVPDGIIDSHDLINIGSPSRPIWVAPSGLIQRQAMLYSPAILPLPPTEDGDRRDIKYFSTSRGTVQTVREAGERVGMFYWKEYE
jgi:Tfp pilus tip-associated adhesin PilY1